MKKAIRFTGAIVLLTILAYFLKPTPSLGEYTISSTTYLNGDFEETLYRRMVADLNALQVPAIQVSVIDNGSRTDFAVGTIDIGRTTTVASDDLFRIGSVTKLYTAVIIMRLVEEGKIRLDDPIDQWFSELPHSEKITVRNLLNHTSGIYNYTEGYFAAARAALFPYKQWKVEEIYNLIKKGKPYFQPGEDHYYSNSNYVLLGLIAQKVTGKSYSQLLGDLVCNELMLENTYMFDDDRSLQRLVAGYDRDILPFGPHIVAPDNKSWPSFGFSAGGVVSSTGDIVAFLEALFNYRIVSQNTLEQMLDFGDFLDEDIPEQTGYGLGLRRLLVEFDTLIGHTGTIPGYGAAAFYCQDAGYYIALVGNLSALHQAHLLSTIVKTIHEFE